MNQQNNKSSTIQRRSPFSTLDHYSMFLSLHSSELKYMVPWDQHEKGIDNKKSVNVEESKMEKNILLDELELNNIEL